MKSRVERYKELHEEIDNSIDERIENKDLSSYANRLNLIDDQFEKMDIDVNASHTPTHARGKSEPEVFDTFENEYLKDFLDEVKAYNVEKGYRSVSDTHNNILSELSTEFKSQEEAHEKVTEEAPVEEIFDESSKQFWDDYVRRNIEKREIKEQDIASNEEDNYDEVRSIAEEVFALTQEIDLGETKVFDEEDFVEEIEAVEIPNYDGETTEYVKEPQDFIEETLEYQQVHDTEEPVSFVEDIEELPVVEEVVVQEVVEETVEEVVEEPVFEETVSSFTTDTNDNLTGRTIAENQNTDEFFSGYYSEMEEELTPKKVRKSRLINAAINIALIGVVLGIALVVRFLLIK